MEKIILTLVIIVLMAAGIGVIRHERGKVERDKELAEKYASYMGTIITIGDKTYTTVELRDGRFKLSREDDWILVDINTVVNQVNQRRKLE